MTEAKLIFKTWQGIRYFSNKIDVQGTYRLWESKSHPAYKHWMKIKVKKSNDTPTKTRR